MLSDVLGKGLAPALLVTTVTNPWPDEFERVLREWLPLLPPGHGLTPDDDLASFGLDSLGIVSLLIAMEDQFDILFPDDLVTPQVFVNPRALWLAAAGLLEDRDRRVDADD